MALEKLEDLEDMKFVQDLLKEFIEKTGSNLAQHILDNWQEEKKFFVKVCVYRQVINTKRKVV